jgi:hypothetical protein
MTSLQEDINNINFKQFFIDDYNNLLDKATKQKEFTTTVFIYDHMIEHNITPNEDTFKLVDRLHSKTVPESNTIRLNLEAKKRLQPRRRIHKIMKGHNYSDKYGNAKQHVPEATELILKNPDYKYYHKIKLAKLLAKQLNIDISIAKVVVTALKRSKLVKCGESNPNGFNLDVFKHFKSNLTVDFEINHEWSKSKKTTPFDSINKIEKTTLSNFIKPKTTAVNPFQKLSYNGDIRRYFKN